MDSQSTDGNAALGALFVAYFLVCLLAFGTVLTQILFFLWIVSGWGISRYLTDKYVLGEETTKTFCCLSVFTGVMGLILITRI